MRRGIIAVAGILCFSLMLGGCASTPKLSEEENELISEYAVSLLLKYDSQNHSRLVDVSEYVTTYEAAVAAREESIRAYEEEQARLEEEKNQQNQAVSEDKKDGTGGAEIIGTPQKEQKTLADVLCVPDFNIMFSDYSTSTNYNGAYASSGKQLVVLFFDITSPNGGTLDGFNNVESIKVAFNGGKYISSTFTTLDQDLAQCIETFNAGETKRFVVIAEVGKDFEVSKIKINVTNIYNESIEATLVQ